MTFTEAAVEVLRLMGKPLHYKKITEIAIEKNLLSHVGKTPETTMSSRLATMVKKDRGDAPIVKVKPGVFALREFPHEIVDEDVEPEVEGDTLEPAETTLEASESNDPEELPEDASPDELGEEPADVPSKELPGADVFPQEEDDDELILANLGEDSRDPRRARKRRGRRRRDREEPRHPTNDVRSAKETRRDAEPRATRAAEDGELVGQDLADAIERALRGRGRQPKALRQVAESLIAAGRLSGAPADLTPTLAAAIRGDGARRRASGDRVRFRELNGSVALFEWEHPVEAVKAEQDAVRAAKRQQESVRRAFVKRLRDFPDGALLELIATWLNAVGVHSIRAVRSEAGDFSLAGTLRRGPEETPLAITIYRGKQPVDNAAIVALRGALHQFDQARIGWLITLGQVHEGTREEALAEGAAPCAVFDGDALATSMEEVGVGIRRVSLPLAVLDVELLDLLGGTARATTQEEVAETNDVNKRRRNRRRGRRRSSREQDVQELTETGEASPVDAASETAFSETVDIEDENGVEVDTDATSAIETSEANEDKEEFAAEGSRDTPVEA